MQIIFRIPFGFRRTTQKQNRESISKAMWYQKSMGMHFLCLFKKSVQWPDCKPETICIYWYKGWIFHSMFNMKPVLGRYINYGIGWIGFCFRFIRVYEIQWKWFRYLGTPKGKVDVQRLDSRYPCNAASTKHVFTTLLLFNGHVYITQTSLYD